MPYIMAGNSFNPYSSQCYLGTILTEKGFTIPANIYTEHRVQLRKTYLPADTWGQIGHANAMITVLRWWIARTTSAITATKSTIPVKQPSF